MKMSKQVSYVIASAAVLSISFWFFSNRIPKLDIDAQTLLNTTDTVVNDFSMRQYSSTGTLTNLLESPQITHIKTNNTHYISNPHTIIAQHNQSPMEINAKQAIAFNGGKTIIFKHSVRIHQDKGEHNEDSTLTTEELTYYPKSKLAKTSKHVLFEQSGNQIQSIGLWADLDKKHIRLLHQVRGFYVPKDK